MSFKNTTTKNTTIAMKPSTSSSSFIQTNGSGNINNKTLIPIKSITRRPRTILKVDHLLSRKGIAALPDMLAEARFRGKKGHELADLRLLLSKTKHWAHRLFPSLTFEDFVEKSEQLGSKKQVKAFLQRLRRGERIERFMGEDNGDDVVVMNKDDDDDDDDEISYVEDDGGPLKSLMPKRQSTSGDGDDNANGNQLEFDRLFKDYLDDIQTTSTNTTSSTITTITTTTTLKQPTNTDIDVDDLMMDDDDLNDF